MLEPQRKPRVPPLRYPEIYRLKEDFLRLIIEINGGITTLDEVKDTLSTSTR